LPSVVAPLPSVIESPIATTAPVLRGACTSISAITYQRVKVSAPAHAASATRLPFARKLVVRDPGWLVCRAGSSLK